MTLEPEVRGSRVLRAVPSLLREDGVFRTYWGAHTISLFGDQVSLVALPLLAVLTLDADAAQMGYLTAIALAPYLLFALHAGAWVDRRGRRRRTMIVADVGRAVLLFTVPVAYVFDALTFEHLYGVAFAVGALTVLFGVSDASLFVAIVSREQYVEASSLLNGSRAFSFVAGPSVAGFLVHACSRRRRGAGHGRALLRFDRAPCEPQSMPRSLRRIPTAGIERLTAMGGSFLIDSATLFARATIDAATWYIWSLLILYATRTHVLLRDARARAGRGHRRRPRRISGQVPAGAPDRNRGGASSAGVLCCSRHRSCSFRWPPGRERRSFWRVSSSPSSAQGWA